MKRIATLLFVLFSAFTLNATGKDGHGPKGDKNDDQIKSAKIAFFTTYIGLTPTEAKDFWPLYDEYRSECRKCHKRGREILEKIKALDSNGNYQERQMTKLLMEFNEAFVKEGELNKLYMNEFLKILPVSKVAKLYLAEEEFRMEMIKTWQKNKGQECSGGPEND